MSDKSRLRWLCRRGMKELDELLLAYLVHAHDAAPPASQAAFARLLEWPDPDLYALLSGRQRSDDPAIDHVVQQILRRPGC